MGAEDLKGSGRCVGERMTSIPKNVPVPPPSVAGPEKGRGTPTHQQGGYVVSARQRRDHHPSPLENSMNFNDVTAMYWDRLVNGGARGKDLPSPGTAPEKSTPNRRHAKCRRILIKYNNWTPPALRIVDMTARHLLMPGNPLLSHSVALSFASCSTQTRVRAMF
jgi:hypothetical protein